MRSGQVIPTDIKPGEPLHVLSRQQAAMLLTLANAILQGKIVRSSKDGFHISDENAVFELKDGELDGNIDGNDPFEILQPNTGTASFRDIQVNSGKLWAYPSPEALAASGFAGFAVDTDVGNFNTTITLPASAAVYVYIGWTLADGWNVYATDTDDGSWIDFGLTDNKHFIIGLVDALTNAGSQELIVSQFVNAHVTWPISGTFMNTLYDGVLTFSGFYNGSRTYIVYSSVVRGLVADGFPADGTYVYIGGGGVGPSSAWFAL